MDATGNPGKSAAQVKEAVENPAKFAARIFSWKESAVIGTVVGMFIGGAAGAGASASKFVRRIDEDLNLTGFGSAIEKSLGYRLSRATRGSINGGVAFGTCSAMYFGVYNWVAEERGALDMYNSVVAGAATGYTIYMMMVQAARAAKVPGSAGASLAVSAVVGSTVGATMLTPVGWLYQKSLEKDERRPMR